MAVFCYNLESEGLGLNRGRLTGLTLAPEIQSSKTHMSDDSSDIQELKERVAKLERLHLEAKAQYSSWLTQYRMWCFLHLVFFVLSTIYLWNRR